MAGRHLSRMIPNTCLVRLCPFTDCFSQCQDALRHPLHTVIGLQDAKKIPGFPSVSADDPVVIGALLNADPQVDPCQEVSIFITVQVVDTPCQQQDSDSHVTLHVTSEFLQHYFLTPEDANLVFKHVHCVPLEKVVFGATTDAAFNWASNDSWSTSLLLAVCQQKTLCRVGDKLLASLKSFESDQDNETLRNVSNLVTLSCYPVSQGILTASTSVTITKLNPATEAIERIIDTKTVLRSLSEEGRQFVDSSLLNFFSIMNYANNLLLPFTLHNPRPSLAITATQAILRTVKTRMLQIRIMPKLSRRFRWHLVNHKSRLEDPENAIFVTEKTAVKMVMADGRWAKVKLHCPSTGNEGRRSWLDDSSYHNWGLPRITGTHPKTKATRSEETKVSQSIHRLAKICIINPGEHNDNGVKEDQVIYMSPQLWFNLNHHPAPLLQPLTRLVLDTQISQVGSVESLHDIDDFIPPFAKEVHVALVQSCLYKATADFATLLQKYFEVPRYIVQGDIICIDARDDISFRQQMENSMLVKDPVVYFKVSMVDGPATPVGHLVDQDHTRLYQAGTVQSYVPMTMPTYFSPSPLHPISSMPMPVGLEHYVDKLQLLVMPFLKLKHSRSCINPMILLAGQQGIGKSTVVKALCKCLNIHLIQVNCHELTSESSAAAEVLVKVPMFAPCILFLKNIEMVGQKREHLREDSRIMSTFCETVRALNEKSQDWPVVTIASSAQPQAMSEMMSSFFLHHINMKVPAEEQRAAMLDGLLSTFYTGRDISIPYIAQRTAGFVLGDLSALVVHAVTSAFKRAHGLMDKYKLSMEEEADVCLAGIPLMQKDLLTALDILQSSHAEAIGTPKIPNVHWEDVGGLAEVKQEILDTIQLPLQHPELVAAGLRRSGVLLYGPPGTGKTLLAKAVATECSLNFLSVKGPELINMYVGQSEENVRKVFDKASSTAPCVIFFDELDSLAPNRGRSGDSGGVMDRVVSQLLAELDGLHKSSEVFVIGATNRPDLLDPALLRPGRFDRLLYVGIPEDKYSRMKILEALTRKFNMATGLNAETIEEQCPQHLTGADFYALCSSAMTNALGRNIEAIEQGKLRPEDAKLVVEEEDFQLALQSLVPSVSPSDFVKYRSPESISSC